MEYRVIVKNNNNRWYLKAQTQLQGVKKWIIEDGVKYVVE